jgi:diketogulonate reductase-like aldo/keto reductase
LIRSIAGKNMPHELLREAASCGFAMDSNQITLNLLDPTRYTRDLRLTCHDLGMNLLLSSPLAGGMLTNRFLDTRIEPPPWELTPTERNYLSRVVTPWARKHTQTDKWSVYMGVVIETLEDVALKHRVSLASVALRWAMQLDHVASVVVACGLGESSDGRPFDRPRQLRQVFRFELDEDDMERLWRASGEAGLQKTPDLNPLDLDFEAMEGGVGNALFLPDASKSRKLWL